MRVSGVTAWGSRLSAMLAVQWAAKIRTVQVPISPTGPQTLNPTQPRDLGQQGLRDVILKILRRAQSEIDVCYLKAGIFLGEAVVLMLSSIS